MNTSNRILGTAARCLVLIAAAVPLVACADSSAAAAPKSALASATPVEPYRLALLEVAYDAASAFPLNPHVKNRSRAQAEVVGALLELDQPDRALQCAAGIANWRRGQCTADIAYHLARRGRTADVEELLATARAIADGAVPPHPNLNDANVEATQEWRRDRVRAAIARTYLALGRPDAAAHELAGAIESEAAQIGAERARLAEPAGFEAEIAALEAAASSGAFDSVRAALAAYVELYGRFYGDVVRREIVEARVAAASTKLPIEARIDAQIGLAEHALEYRDAEKGLAIVAACQALLDTTRGSAEADIPIAARLAALRHRAGDQVRARADLDATLTAYDAARDGLVDIYRAGVLRPIAEAYAAIGDVAAARSVYARALEEGVHNPNSRPRADDLVATAASMAVHGVEPDAAMTARVRAIRAQLGNPW